HHHIPTHIITIPHLPLTPNGKIDHTALNAIPLPRTQAEDGEWDAVQRAVAGIWAEAIGAGPRSLDDSFFALGGTSLAAMRVAAAVAATMRRQVTVGSVFTHQTFGAFAEHCRQAPVTRPGARVPLTARPRPTEGT
ncbi:phosphopantetheine-binding protein, partial [Nonomuraea monospora]|uniref:phosphopantetheine-binding protein n=1 Tax=Nonomuraea monospora TaxID=568818 RepID=UPI0031DAA8AD